MKILEGHWSEVDLDWELILDKKLPDEKLISSVVSCTFYNDSILLTRNDRGWELAGGHIENGETIIQALHREVKEEVGADVIKEKLIGYYKLNPINPIQRKNGDFYPFPHSYIPFYLCECNNLSNFTGEEILETKLIKISEIDNYEFTNKESVKLLLKYR